MPITQSSVLTEYDLSTTAGFRLGGVNLRRLDYLCKLGEGLGVNLVERLFSVWDEVIWP